MKVELEIRRTIGPIMVLPHLLFNSSPGPIVVWGGSPAHRAEPQISMARRRGPERCVTMASPNDERSGSDS